MTTPKRTRLVATVAVVLALSGALTGVGTAIGQGERPTLRTTDGTATGDGNTSVDIVLSAAPNGLSGYYLDVAVESPADARIVDASYPEQFGLTTAPDYTDDGVSLEAADVNGSIESGATDVHLATVVVAGPEAELSVDPRQFDADDGGRIEPVQANQQQQSSPDRSAGDGQAATGETATDGAAATGTTDGSGPFPAVLVLVAVAVLAAIGYSRQRER